MEQLRIEATIAQINSITHEVFDNKINPLSVYFKHPAPESSIDYVALDAHLKAEPTSSEECHSLVQQVRSQISQSLSEGVPTIFDTAQQLGMSGRTLQRRLSKQGYSFQTLVDESRRQLSERLLRETDYSLSEIAFMTGYSEQSAFTRAFKRWAGQTPRSYRLNVIRDPQKLEHRQALPKVWQEMSRGRVPMLVFFCL
ncbi:MAG: helix-turn-helix transcriptional regulator [Rhodothermaceae bacterium]|nr:helix-turn-helix transcriptional regulator [Rhodothermaceae bacterium]